ncbi:MAG TPA: glycosyltransferase [Gemmatimonadales bacterium]|jgi:alpha-1,6-mannosyltransferase|nr:glycosyltransferase [Gemmatimonadales bacterium]
MPMAGTAPDVFADSNARECDLQRLPPVERAAAGFAALDVSEYYGPDSGGVRTYLHEKARYVARRDDLRQVFVLPGPGNTVRSGAGARVYRVRAPRIPFQDTYRILLEREAIRAIMTHERPDVVEVGSAYGAPWVAAGAARSLGIPLVWYFHAHLPNIIAPERHGASTLRRGAASIAIRYVRAVARRMTLVLAGSESVRRDLHGYGIAHVEVVPLGVDTETFHPSRRAGRAATLARLGLPDAPLVLYTGRFTAEKQLEAAVAAWGQVRASDAVLVLAGAGPRADALRAAAGPRVRIMPFEPDREKLADLYAAADLYLAPGPAETFGLSAHEAMAAGTPVLSVDAGAVADAVRAARCGGTWPLGDKAAMAALVDQQLDVAAEMREVARAHVTQYHQWATVFDRLFALYGRLKAGSYR